MRGHGLEIHGIKRHAVRTVVIEVEGRVEGDHAVSKRVGAVQQAQHALIGTQDTHGVRQNRATQR